MPFTPDRGSIGDLRGRRGQQERPSPFVPTAAKTGTYTARYWEMARFDTTAAPRTCNLPTAVGCTGRTLAVKNMGAVGNVVTIVPDGTDTCDVTTVVDGECVLLLAVESGVWEAYAHCCDGGSSSAGAPTCLVTFGAEVADTIRVSIQVSVSGRWLVDFYITPSLHGDPDATDNAYALVTGTPWETVTADAAYTVLSNLSGLIEFDVTILDAVSPTSRWVYAEVRPVLANSGEIDWAGAGGGPGTGEGMGLLLALTQA